MKYLLHCFSNYAIFTGRAGRKEYWAMFILNFVLFNTAFICHKVFGLPNIDLGDLGIWVKALLTDMPVPAMREYYVANPQEASGMGIVPFIVGIFLIIPLFAVEIRRLHDLNLSTLFILANLIPFIGWIWFIVVGCIRGTEGENNYGPEPQYD